MAFLRMKILQVEVDAATKTVFKDFEPYCMVNIKEKVEMTAEQESDSVKGLLFT